MRPRLSSIVLAPIIGALFGTAPALAGARPEYDVVATSRASSLAASHLRWIRSEPALRPLGTVASVDERLGVPTFVWAVRTHPSMAAAPDGPRDVEQAARAHLERFAPFYRLEAADAGQAMLRRVHDTGRGPIIATFAQEVDGVEVFRDEIKVLMSRDLELVAVSGYLAPAGLGSANSGRTFRLDAATSIEAALEDLGAGAGRSSNPLGPAPGGYEVFGVEGGAFRPVRVKRVLFHLPDALEPGYYLELMSDSQAYSYVVSARDGRILFRHDLTANDAYTYRVWADGTAPHAPFDGPQGTAPTPHPTGVPDFFVPSFVPSQLVTLQNGPISTNDPWLPLGATETVGNNVDAYVDRNTPDGLNGGDFRASVTSPGIFDRQYDLSQIPLAGTGQQMASITQLFYTTNYLHDWFYDAGFDEASGNAQASNYGRGGIGGDRLLVEAQDYSGTNNANTATPADGASPRIQMFIYKHPLRSTLTVTAPSVIAGEYPAVVSRVGPISVELSGDLVLVDDGSGVTTDGCQPIVNSVAGKIALMDLPQSCGILAALINAQNAGAIAVIVANNDDSPPYDFGSQQSVSIPAVSVSRATGNTFKAELLSGPVTVTIESVEQVDRDGSLDNQIVAHEWGHQMSQRLIGNANGLTTQQSAGLNEGWSDFHSLLLTVRPEDALAPANSDFSGAYSAAGYALMQSLLPTNESYFGIRRYPYSTDLAKNPLTFRHIEAGVPLPAGPPIAFGEDGAGNAEVHNTGEVWCNMLWECYAALLRDSGRIAFDEACRRMREYLVASQKMTPNNPTMTEARDALLAVSDAADVVDFQLFCQAFARRGLGSAAVSPDRYGATNSGVVESFACGGALALVDVTLDDDVASCDSDGYIDNGETGALRVSLRNVGGIPLTATHATVTSSHPAVSFPNGNTIVFPASVPFSASNGALSVSVSGAAGIQPLDFQIQYDDPNLLEPGPPAEAVTFYGNADASPGSIETVEATNPPWTMSGAQAGADEPWRRVEIGPTQHRFAAVAPSVPSEQSLVTPPLQVGPTGNFSFTFSQAYSFEFAGTRNNDGGVIEISGNGGASWSDIGGLASPGYGGVLSTLSGNPLGGRQAYVGLSPGYPALQTVTVNLGNTWAGQTVLVRFRLAADRTIASTWEIDDVSFSNLAHLPFQSLGADGTPCTPTATGESRPTDWSLSLVGANPVLGPARLRFTAPARSHVLVSIYDVAGRRVNTLASGDFEVGEHQIVWDRSAASAKAGVYFARLETGSGRLLTRRIVVTGP